MHDGEPILLGFSGGIDSCAAASTLKADGWSVTALTLDMTGDEHLTDEARRRAADMDIPIVVMDVRDEFRAITTYFVDSYTAGRTPAPCTLCNSLIKWPSLVSEADRLGIRAIATGHYFNTTHHNGHIYVSRADDRTKDQSYYLWGLSQSTLERIVTPMGHIFKSDLKRAEPRRRESMGVCFLNGTTYGRYVAGCRPDSLRRGDIVDIHGRVIGRHDGIAFYTIGQKRGLDAAVKGMCIVGIDAARNMLIAGDDAMLYHSTLEITDYNIVDMNELLSADDIEVVIRGIGRNPASYARRIELTGTGIRVTLGSPAWAPAAGQPAVFYRGNRVIGGGIVEKYY